MSLLLLFGGKTVSFIPFRLPFTGNDGSGVITVGGAAQYLFGNQTPPDGYSIFNNNATEVLWFSETEVASIGGAGCIQIAPYTEYRTPMTYQPVGPVSIFGATTGHKITAKWW
jgi:hypothetical protein